MYDKNNIEKYIKTLQSRGVSVKTETEEKVVDNQVVETKTTFVIDIPANKLGIKLWGMVDFLSQREDVVVNNLNRLALLKTHRENVNLSMQIWQRLYKIPALTEEQVYGY